MSVQAEVPAADVPAELARPLGRAVLSLADSKRLMGIRYSDWLLGAPSIEAGIAASSMCQDEWGHARLLYAMLKDFGLSPTEVEHERPASAYTSLDALDHPFRDWGAVVAGMVVVDGALSAALAAVAAGRYEQAVNRIPKMLAEEEFHADLGGAWLRRLATSSQEARDRLGTACARFLPRVLAWIEPDDAGSEALVEAGLREAPAETRARFEGAVGPLLSLLGMDVSTVAADRSDWDPDRNRGPGHPDEESVVRARGDLNRSLLVE